MGTKVLDLQQTSRYQETSSPDQVIYFLKQQIFEIDSSNKLAFKPGIYGENEPYTDNMHSPLAVLHSIYRNGIIPVSRTLGEAKQIENTYDGTELFQQDFIATPGEIVEQLLTISTGEEAENATNSISESIRSARRVLLTGCISVYSAFSLLDVLHKYGFSGELIIIDVSSIPLLFIDKYKELFGWKERFGIEVKTVRKSFQEEIESTEQQYDIVISDVLGHYLDDVTLERDISALLWNRISDGGVALIRDLGEYEAVSGQEALIGKLIDTTDTQAFISWIKTNFGWDVSVTDVESMLQNMWPTNPHGDRKDIISERWKSPLGKYFELLKEVLFRVGTNRLLKTFALKKKSV